MHGGYFGDDDRGSIAGDSLRPIRDGGDTPGLGGFSRASRTGSMVLLDEAAFGSSKRASEAGGAGEGGTSALNGLREGLWVDQADYESMAALSEFAIAGKPAFGGMLEEETGRAGGSLIVASESGE
jgi:hypothetical protein